MDINEQLEELGYSIESTLLRDNFNPRKVSGDHVHLVTIHYKGKSMECEFTQGCARRHYRGIAGRPGKPIKIPYGRMKVCDVEDLSRSIPDKPKLADVLYSLLIDSEVGMNAMSFGEFCAEFGCDEDSREAFRIFEACQEQYTKARRLGVDLEALNELLQDY